MISVFKTLVVALALLIAVNAQCSGDTPRNATPAFACSNAAWYTAGNADIIGGTQTWESHVFVSGNTMMGEGAILNVNRNWSISGRLDITNGAQLHLDNDAHVKIGAALMLSSGGQLHLQASNPAPYNVTQCIDAAGGAFHVWGLTNGMTYNFPTNCIISYPGSIVGHSTDPCFAPTITYSSTGTRVTYASTGAQGCAPINNPPAIVPGTTAPSNDVSGPTGSNTNPNPDNGGVSAQEVSLGLVALSVLLIAARSY